MGLSLDKDSQIIRMSLAVWIEDDIIVTKNRVVVSSMSKKNSTPRVSLRHFPMQPHNHVISCNSVSVWWIGNCRVAARSRSPKIEMMELECPQVGYNQNWIKCIIVEVYNMIKHIRTAWSDIRCYWILAALRTTKHAVLFRFTITNPFKWTCPGY